MRLVIAFDHDFEFLDSDIIISDLKPVCVKDSLFAKVEVNPRIDYVKNIEDFVNGYFKILKSSLIKDVIKCSINNFNRNWLLHSLAWIHTLNNVIDKFSIDKIIIVGYTKPINYIPYYEAEGEIGSKILYKTKDVLPYMICKVLKDKNLSYEILNKQSALSLKFKVLLRRYGLLVYKLFFFSFKVIKRKKDKTLDTRKYRYVVLSRAISHTEFVEKFVKTFKVDVLLHVSNSISSKDTNTKYVKSNNFDNAIYNLNSVRLFHVIISFFEVSTAIIKVLFSKNVYLYLEGQKFNFSSALIEMLISYFDALVYKRSIETLDFNPNSVLIISEMYTPQAYVVAKVARQKNLLSAQLQSFAMLLRKEPSFFYSDYFFTNNEQNAKVLRSIYPEHKDKINFIGNLSVVEQDNKATKEIKQLKKIVYFSQPLHNENKEEFSIINKLSNMEEIYGFELYVKLHPRETNEKYNKFPDLKFIDQGLTFNQYIEDVDLAVIRTTSIGQQLILNNIPTIFCLLSETAKNAKVDFIDHKFFGTIFKIEDLEAKILEKNVLIDAFSDFRSNYIKQNNLDKGIYHFYKNISNL